MYLSDNIRRSSRVPGSTAESLSRELAIPTLSLVPAPTVETKSQRFTARHMAGKVAAV